MTDKRCGTCAHWSAWKSKVLGLCVIAIPVLPASMTVNRISTALNAGTNCPYWTPKEATDNEGK